MSLDVYLRTREEAHQRSGSGIFIRENGSTREISVAEWNEKFPGREPIVATLPEKSETVFQANITHNLGRMADAAGIYEACWRPEEINAKLAKDIIPLLESGLAKMKADPKHFEQFNASNGWGLYEHFVPWIERYLEACKAYPEAEIEVSR